MKFFAKLSFKKAWFFSFKKRTRSEAADDRVASLPTGTNPGAEQDRTPAFEVHIMSVTPTASSETVSPRHKLVTA